MPANSAAREQVRYAHCRQPAGLRFGAAFLAVCMVVGMGLAAWTMFDFVPQSIAPPAQVTYPAMPNMSPSALPPTFSLPGSNGMNGPGPAAPPANFPPTYIPQRVTTPQIVPVPTPSLPPHMPYPPYPMRPGDREWGQPANEPSGQDRTNRDWHDQHDR